MTAASTLEFDEIGHWSELKLDIVGKYGAAYTNALRNAANLKKFYIDGYCGAGVHVSKRTRTQVEGSPARALNVSPPFDGFYFIDMDAGRTAHLQSICKGRNDVIILTGDANVKLTTEVLPKIHFSKFNRALCLLDPYGLHLDWEVMLQAGQSQAIDMFLNFPVMDMNRNAIWKNPEAVPKDGIERMTRFWAMNPGRLWPTPNLRKVICFLLPIWLSRTMMVSSQLFGTDCELWPASNTFLNRCP